LVSANTLTYDEKDDYETIGYTIPWDEHDHDHAQVQDEQEILELVDIEIPKMDRPNAQEIS
jgi:uncharacterized protein (DUF39 family)